jgi:hypothetical protein
VKPEAELARSRGQHSLDSARVVLPLEEHHEVSSAGESHPTPSQNRT